MMTFIVMSGLVFFLGYWLTFMVWWMGQLLLLLALLVLKPSFYCRVVKRFWDGVFHSFQKKTISGTVVMGNFVCLPSSALFFFFLSFGLMSSCSASFLNSWWSLCDNWDSSNMLLHVIFIPEAIDSISSFLPCLGKISTWMKASWL